MPVIILGVSYKRTQVNLIITLQSKYNHYVHSTAEGMRL